MNYKIRLPIANSLSVFAFALSVVVTTIANLARADQTDQSVVTPGPQRMLPAQRTKKSTRARRVRSARSRQVVRKKVLYAMPFKGEDLKPGERYYTGNHSPGIQGEGEDFGALRYLGSRKWSGLIAGRSGSSNADFVVYGKPIYAIADGTIVGCWRNAPENPNPPARHEKFNDGFIPGGGNMLFVDHPDGKRVLYAHMIPGTMPAKLCPNNDKFFPKKMTIAEGDAFLMLATKDKVKIKKGEFLGKVGNSGSSGGSHLHLHAEKSGAAAIMQFEQGLYKPYQVDKTDISGGWKSYAGGEIPDGEVLLRPPRSVSYRMVDFESYSDGKTQMYAGILEPGSYAPFALFESNWNTFLKKWQDAENNGYRMKDFEAYQQGVKLVYSGIFEPGSYVPYAVFEPNWNTFVKRWRDAEKQGYRMKDLEVYRAGGKLMFAGILAPGEYGPAAEFWNNWNDFYKAWQQHEKNGYRLKDLEVYEDGGRLHYAGIFEPGSFGPAAAFRNNWQDFYKTWQNTEKNGYRLKDLEVYKEGGKLIYVGIFEPGNYAPAAVFRDNWNDFVEAWQNLE